MAWLTLCAIGDTADSILTRKCIVETVRQFDTIKKEFDPFEGDCEEEYEIPIKGAPEMPEIGLTEGYLKLSKYDPPPMISLSIECGAHLLLRRDEQLLP